MLDAVDDHVVLVAENDVAVLAHQFDDELLGAKVSHFIQVLDPEIEDPLHPGLGDGKDPAVLDVLAKQHAEAGSRDGAGLVSGREVGQGKGGRSRQGEPVLAAVVFYGKKQLVRFGLCDLVDPPARERIGKLFADRCNGNAVKCHDVSSFLKKIRTVSSIPARPSAHKSFLTGSALCFIIK